MSCCGNNKPSVIGMPDSCCTATTGCVDFNRNLSNVKVEPIYVQKVYDTALFNLQSIVNGMGVKFSPKLSPGSTIEQVLAIRCRKYFDPDNTSCPHNLMIDPTTHLQGAQFIQDDCGKDVTVVGPDGFDSQKIIYVDTEHCDDRCKGTPIYGTQNIGVSGDLSVEIDVMVRKSCSSRCKVTLSAQVPVGTCNRPLTLTNFFELCVPSTSDGAFFPRFTEFCNLNCEPRLATNNIKRDFVIDDKGNVSANLIVALCVSCEKKIVVPVQLCVLSTGFPELSPETSSVCNSYPSLFPKQIDKESIKECLKDKESDTGCRKPSHDDCKKPSHDDCKKPTYRGLSLDDDLSDSEDI